MSSTPERLLGRLTLAAILLVFGAGCLLRLIWLDSDSWFPNPSRANPLSLNFEEKASAIPARNWVLFGDLDSYGGPYQPQQMMPLGFLVHAAWFRVFGVSLVQTRLPFVLLNLLAWTGLLVLSRRQLGPATLLLLTVVTGFNLTLLAYQRSSLDETLLLGTLVLAAACAPEPGAPPRAHFLWGLLAFPPLALEATGLWFAAGPLLAQATRLRRERLHALCAGAGVAGAAAAGLYAALGGFRANTSMGHVPPLSGIVASFKAFEANLPIPERATLPVLLLALVAPLAVRRASPLTRFAWTALVCAFVAGAPVYLDDRRVVPLVPIVFYLAAAALQGVLDRLESAPRPRLAMQAACGVALVAGLWALLITASAGTEDTAHLFLDRGPVRAYHDAAFAMRSALPPGATLAAPDTFRLVAFDTPYRYRFTHDMVARHVLGLSEEEAARRDACGAGLRYLVEGTAVAEEPGRVVFDIRRFDAGRGCGAAALTRGTRSPG